MPELVDGAVVIGQIVKKIFFNEEVMEGLSRAGVPESKLAVIRSADAEHFSPKDLQLIASCLRKYTDAYQNRNGRQPVRTIPSGISRPSCGTVIGKTILCGRRSSGWICPRRCGR